MMNKHTEQAQMKAEVHRMNMNNQIHEMCSLIESLQKMQRKFEKGYEGRLKQLEATIAEYDGTRVNDLVQSTEERLNGLVKTMKKDIGLKFESMQMS